MGPRGITKITSKSEILSISQIDNGCMLTLILIDGLMKYLIILAAIFWWQQGLGLLLITFLANIGFLLRYKFYLPSITCINMNYFPSTICFNSSWLKSTKSRLFGKRFSILSRTDFAHIFIVRYFFSYFHNIVCYKIPWKYQDRHDQC